MADEGVTKLIVTAHPPGVGARTSLVRWAWKQLCLNLSQCLPGPPSSLKPLQRATTELVAPVANRTATLRSSSTPPCPPRGGGLVCAKELRRT